MKDDAAKKLLDNVFQHSFDKDRFKQFIVELFNEFSFRESSYAVWKEYSEYIESYETLGTYNDSDRRKIEVLIVKLRRASSRDRARTMQRNFVAKFLKNGNKEAALVAFYGDDPTNWRFSYVKMEYSREISDSGKLLFKEELTPAKRYSFLVGEQEPNHTCRRQFLDLILEEQKNPLLQDIESCFSVEKVTEEFFEEYKKLFLELKESLENALEKNPIGKTEFQEKNISTVDFSKKLLGQIVFLYFLQKKGWLGIERDSKTKQMGEWGSGPKNFMRKLFEKQIVPYDNFFNDILEPLFYEALADDRSANNDYYSRFKCKIPFLNGGLFEPINDYNWTDSNILLDNLIFERIFETFDRFNFTIKEDEPLEREVAVDPEVLGKVFENLLEIKDRKSKGAFYTPREIVHYMCQQSLIGYLENNSSIPREDLEVFVRLGDFALGATIMEQADKYYGKSPTKSQSITLPESIKQNYELLDRLLKDVKIIDPAVGSGAFPVGMMNEIVKARSILTPFFPTGKMERTSYELKRQTIENSLYGVDIDSSAVDIAKLRFWLSLIVDEENIKEIRPLPNLDHKIMCGDSLVEEFEGVKLFDESLLGETHEDRSDEIAVIDAKIEVLSQKLNAILTGKDPDGDSKALMRGINKLQSAKRTPSAPSEKGTPQLTIDEAVSTRISKSRHKLAELKTFQKLFFNEQNRTKKQEYRTCIERLEWELIEETLKETNNTDACKKLAEYRRNKSKPFFIWKLYFAEVFQRINPGFDIVIANPPYVRQESLKTHKEYFKAHFTVYSSLADLYVYFIERGLSLLRTQGIFNYIVANKWMRTSFGKPLRKYLLYKQIEEIVDFGDLPIFKTATTYTCILQVSNKNPSHQFRSVKVKTLHITNLDDYILKNGHFINPFNLTDEGWSLGDPQAEALLKKLNVISVSMEQYTKGEIFRGIVSGFDKAFVIDNITREALIRKDPRNSDIIKPYTIGKDIKRYHTPEINKYVIFIPWHFPLHNDPSIKGASLKAENEFKKQYPVIYDYLFQFKKELSERNEDETGIRYEWYALQRYGSNFYTEFEKPKIIYLKFQVKPAFTFDSRNSYSNSATFFIPRNDLFLLGLLNSKLGWFSISNYCTQIQNGYQLVFENFGKIPIRKINTNNSDDVKKYNLITSLVRKMLILNRNSMSQNQDQSSIIKQIEETDNLINELIFELYGLTDEEIRYIKENVKF
jgi:Eco57I restriction endonuclease.